MSEHRFPIRTVASITGVNAITLRAWERRYGLIRPLRTESGHRLYSQADIDTIHRVTALLERGLAIGQASAALAAPTAAPTVELPRVVAAPSWASYRTQMIGAISQFDEGRLEQVYNELLGLHPTATVTKEVLLPLLAELGRRWESAEGSVAEEHFFGVYLRNKLGARFHHRSAHEHGPRLIASCIRGERHEVGLLLFALAAHEHGYQVILLGADMPLAELPVAARRARADAIVLSGSIDPQPGVLDQDLPRLVREAGVPVFIGGLTSVNRHDAIASAGAESLGSDIAPGLRRLAERLAA